MKKVIIGLFAILLAISFCACTGNPADTSKDESATPDTSVEESKGGEESTEEPTAVAYGFEGEKELAETGVVNDVAPETVEETYTGNFGFILVGDETEGYTKAHMDGIKKAAEELGISPDRLKWRYSVPETDAVQTAANQLIADGCEYIFSNSYGHQDYMLLSAQKNPNVKFVACTGDSAAKAGLKNFSNAFTAVYESRYISGVVAGLKLRELIDDGKVDGTATVKIGYVGAYNYAEVVSGYTAFFLGVKSVVENIEMDVYYTSSWFDFDKEKAAAELLMERGCVIIGQHADSAGAPTAVQAALKAGKVAYSVGYNVSMLDVAPDAALTSASNNWGVYYKYALAQGLQGKEIATNWCGGYEVEGVAITELGESCADGTEEKVNELIDKIVKGEFHVFDTSKFTVGGKSVAWAFASDTNGDWTNDADNVIADGYFHESFVQSAPAFYLRIDGITELN